MQHNNETGGVTWRSVYVVFYVFFLKHPDKIDWVNGLNGALKRCVVNVSDLSRKDSLHSFWFGCCWDLTSSRRVYQIIFWLSCFRYIDKHCCYCCCWWPSVPSRLNYTPAGTLLRCQRINRDNGVRIILAWVQNIRVFPVPLLFRDRLLYSGGK